MASGQGTLVFDEIHGTAEVYVNGILAAQKTDPAPGEITVIGMAASEMPVTVTVLVRHGGDSAGIAGVVRWVVDRTAEVPIA